MNRTATYVRNRLSLRSPQEESLAILSELAEILPLEKGNALPPQLDAVRERYPTCTDFERTFPSMCFALATGVGKTRLMGAFIAYLYLEKGLRNFFVMAPNLTVYTKLIEDLSNPNNPKYVFPGIGEFAQKPPRVVTGDNYEYAGQQVLFADEMIKEAEAHYAELVEELVTNIIEIPRIIIQQSEEVRSGFQDFDLDVSALNFQPVSEEILRKSLADNEEDTIVGSGRIVPDRLDFILVNALINFPEIDYDEQADQLFRLAEQALAKLQSYLDEGGLINVIQYYKREIAKFVYTQMMEHFYCEAPEYKKPIVRPFTEIEQHNFSKYAADSIHDYTETITPAQAIPGKVFTGFKKACHNLYKFDSKTEKDFAAILERDADVLKWLRPARHQFRLYWRHNSRQYVPDFVVETADTIFMVETKQERDLNADEVQEKAVAAQEYCRHATEYMGANGGKPWSYVVIPHNAVLLNMGFATLAKMFDHAVRG